MTDINDTVKQAIANATPSQIPPPAQLKAPEPVVIPQHVAANICKMLERTDVKGMESVAWCEAYQYMQRIANGGPGVPFAGLAGK